MNARFSMTPLSPAHVAVLAALHDEAFAEGWSAEAFASALAQPGAFGFLATVEPGGEPLGFALLRAARFDGGGEAEVLTIATRPSARRHGVARAVMDAALVQARAWGVTRVFLEVAADNAAAQALYDRLGFAAVGRRKGYYARPAHAPLDQAPQDAIVMALDLSAHSL